MRITGLRFCTSLDRQVTPVRELSESGREEVLAWLDIDKAGSSQTRGTLSCGLEEDRSQCETLIVFFCWNPNKYMVFNII